MNYDVRRKDRQSSSKSTSAEVLTVRGKNLNQKSKSDRGKSKSRLGFRDLKKNQCAFYKELEHCKVDCPRIKDKNKESKTEANLARVINTQLGRLHKKVDQTQTQRYSLSQSLLLLLVTQVILSGY